MVEPGQVEWPIERIPDEDFLFLRVHRTYIGPDALLPGAFSPHGRGLSTNWSRYATAEWTRADVGVHPTKGTPRDPNDYGVVSLEVGPVRRIPTVVVQHNPLPQNRAHTDIEFSLEDRVEVRVHLGRLYQWCIQR